MAKKPDVSSDIELGPEPGEAEQVPGEPDPFTDPLTLQVDVYRKRTAELLAEEDPDVLREIVVAAVDIFRAGVSTTTEEAAQAVDRLRVLIFG